MQTSSASVSGRHDGGRVLGLVAAAALAVSVPAVLPQLLAPRAVAVPPVPAVAAPAVLSHAGSWWAVGKAALTEAGARAGVHAGDAKALQAKAAERARQARAAAVRVSRAMTRAPLAERSRWAAKPARPRSRPVEKPPPMTDLQKAEILPEPWRSIVRCESVRDRSWRMSAESRARGWFQFLPSTWRSLGLSGDPAAASFDEQYAAARELARRDGLRAWDCARILGLA